MNYARLLKVIGFWEPLDLYANGPGNNAIASRYGELYTCSISPSEVCRQLVRLLAVWATDSHALSLHALFEIPSGAVDVPTARLRLRTESHDAVSQ